MRCCTRVFGGAKVHGHAELYGYAMVYENADVETGVLSENAKVHGNAHLYGEGSINIHNHAEIWGKAELYSRNGDGIAVSDSAVVYGNAKIYGDGNETQIWCNAEVGDDAKISGGAMIGGDAKVLDFAAVDGASINGGAVVCGYTIVPQGCDIKDKAYLNLPDNSPGCGETFIEPGTRLCGNAWIKSQEDYLVMGPFMTGDPTPKKLVFNLTREKRVVMTILICFNAVSSGYLKRKIYQIDDPEELKRELQSIHVRMYDEEAPLRPESIEVILAMAECARKHFAGRIEELSVSNQ